MPRRYLPVVKTGCSQRVMSRYGFLVPYKQVRGPVGRVNTELTADGYTGPA